MEFGVQVWVIEPSSSFQEEAVKTASGDPKVCSNEQKSLNVLRSRMAASTEGLGTKFCSCDTKLYTLNSPGAFPLAAVFVVFCSCAAVSGCCWILPTIGLQGVQGFDVGV